MAEDVFTGRNDKHVVCVLVGNILQVSYKTILYHLRIKSRRDVRFLLYRYLNLALDLPRG